MRSVPAGQQIWGSIGLVKGSAGADGANGVQCKANGTPRERTNLQRIELLSPLLVAEVSRTPELKFTTVGDAEAVHVVVLVPIGRENEAIEFKVPGTTHELTAKPPAPLRPGVWTWTVYALWPDCYRTEPMSWAFFQVNK
jgi:hypothetical protein